MKKKLLFIIPSLSSGGGEKSLINLLSLLDYDKYDVDLFLFNQRGIFLNLLPKEVEVLKLPTDYKNFMLPIFKSIIKFIVQGRICLALDRFMYSKKLRDFENTSKAEQYTWRYLSNSLPMMGKEYDAAIGYLEKSSIYFAVDKVKANKKIGWIHTDYERLEVDQYFDDEYFNKLNYLVTVSNECKVKLTKAFKWYSNKILVMNNILAPGIIYKMSEDKKQFEIKEDNKIIILTIGRLEEVKGIDLAVKACAQIVKQGYDIKWYVIGSGKLKEKIEQLINDKKVENVFILLGEKINPYSYIKNCDIYVQPSRVEGKSIAIDEAKILQKPIVTTNYPTVSGQISHKVNGYIVDINEKSIATGIINLINNKPLVEKMINNLKFEKVGNEEDIELFYKMID